MHSICVFCGSSLGKDPFYRQEVRHLGKLLADMNLTLVYGGGKVGLMGVLADSVLENSGKVIGIMPESIVRLEIAHDHLTQLHIVKGMHERKALMAELADAFVALPGGLGTLDELSEILTFNQLRISDKPVGLFNIGGYFNHLITYIGYGVSEGFVREEHFKNLIVSCNAQELLTKLRQYVPVIIDEWIREIREETERSN